MSEEKQLEKFEGFLGLYDHTGRPCGKYQKFEYDPAQFEIAEVQQGSGDTRPYKTLKYIGGEVDGSKIDIPEGLKTADYMFDGINLSSAPIVSMSVQDTKGMFNGILTEGAYSQCEWNLENRGFDSLDENIDSAESLAANRYIKMLDDGIDMCSSYYKAIRTGFNLSDLTGAEKQALDENAKQFENTMCIVNNVSSDKSCIDGFKKLDADFFQKQFDNLCYARANAYGGAFGPSPYAESLYDFEKGVSRSKATGLFARVNRVPEDVKYFQDTYGEIEAKQYVDKADYVDFDETRGDYRHKYIVGSVKNDKGEDIPYLDVNTGLIREGDDRAEGLKFFDSKKAALREIFGTASDDVKFIDKTHEPHSCGGNKDAGMTYFYSGWSDLYAHNTEDEIAAYAKANMPAFKDMDIDEIKDGHIYWGTDGPMYKGFYNGDTYVLFEDIEKLPDAEKQDALSNCKKYIAERNKDRDLGKEYTDAIVENGTKKKGFYIPKKGEETVMITNISPKGISERKGKDGGKYYVVGMSVDKETSESGYAKITCQEDNITANKRYLHFKGDKERNVQVTKDGKIETIKMKISELSAAHDRGLEEKSREKSARFDREGAVQSEFGGVKSVDDVQKSGEHDATD